MESIITQLMQNALTRYGSRVVAAVVHDLHQCKSSVTHIRRLGLCRFVGSRYHQRSRRSRLELKPFTGLLLGDDAGISWFNQRHRGLLLHIGRREPLLRASTGVGKPWPSLAEI